MKNTQFALCEGRHEMPVDKFVFDSKYFETHDMFDFVDSMKHCDEVFQETDENDELEIWVTGLTPALTAVIAWCEERHRGLILHHYDRNTGEYREQRMFSDIHREYLVEGGYGFVLG